MKNTEEGRGGRMRDAELSAGEFMEMLRHRWLVLVMSSLLGALAGLGLGLTRPTVYETTASGVLISAEGEDLSKVFAGENLAKSRAITYESLATTRPVAEAVVADLGFDLEPEDLLSRISTSVPVGTTEIQVTAQGATSEAAQQLADAWIRALSAQVDSFSSEAPSLGGSDAIPSALRLVPVGSAYLPEEPSAPRMAMFVGGGALLGLLLGIAFAVSETGMTGLRRQSGTSDGAGSVQR